MSGLYENIVVYLRNKCTRYRAFTLDVITWSVACLNANRYYTMKTNLAELPVDIGVVEAKKYSKTYCLDNDSNDLMVFEEVGMLQLSQQTFHMGIVIISVCREGELQMMMNGREVKLSKGGLFVNIGDSVISEVRMSDDYSATAIAVSQDFLQESVMSLMHLWPYLLYLMEQPVVMLGEKEMQRLVCMYQQIIGRLQQEDHSFRREATIACLQACYLDVCDFLKRKIPQRSHMQMRSYALFDQFVRLVASNYVKYREVQWYADEMKLTPKYLSEVVKEVSGRTSSQWITNFVIAEVKSLLRNSDLSIKEIAVEMNFPNQSFLGKYFKNVVGMSPSEFRSGKNGRPTVRE